LFRACLLVLACICVWSAEAQSAAVCGDGIVGEGEACDDGNNINGDGCSNCEVTRIARCGDFYLDAGEECDDGNLNVGDGCTTSCSKELEYCGDGKLLAPEECDDGNPRSNDGCSSSCRIEISEPICGNGIVEAEEICDDGSSTNGPCSATCDLFEKKSPTRARNLAIGGTLSGLVIVIPVVGIIPGGAGIFVGPSLGHIYSGAYGRALLFSSARLGAPFLVAVIDESLNPNRGGLDSIGVALIGGALLCGALDVVEIIVTPMSTRLKNQRYSERLKANKSAQSPSLNTLTVSPTMIDRSRFGMSLSLKF
jgi:cysteine-rich repeat protein